MSYGTTIRENFSADWAFGVISGMENAVRKAFPQEVRRWPLLQNFDFEAYAVGHDHFVIVLRDKLSGIPSGSGVLQPFPHRDYPPLPVTMANLDQWLSYLSRKFELRDEDAAMILPIHDSGRSDPPADFAMFSQEERQIWYQQLRSALNRHAAALKIPTHASSLEAQIKLVREIRAAIRAATAEAEVRSKVERATEALHSKLRLESATTDAAEGEWDVFVCHASEDKEEFVRPFAQALREARLRVWYDEFTLTLGDSLRRSIDRGLGRSRYGIVVLSPNFFAKDWPQRELDGLAGLELNGRKVILPLWHKIDAAGVRVYSPMLADRVAASTSESMNRLVTAVLSVVRPAAIA
jgi:hypothetical protein